MNESRIIKNAGVDNFLKLLGKLGRSTGAGKIVEKVRKNDLVCRLRHRHNQIDLRQLVPPIREDTRVCLQNMLADDMRELAHQLGKKDLPWPSWEAMCNK